MKKILLVYPPFCTPASPPYSIANLYGLLKVNLGNDYSIDVLDLNLIFHQKLFPKYREYCKNLSRSLNPDNFEMYDVMTKKFLQDTKTIYSRNNKLVVNGIKPELFNDLYEKIISLKPDTVAFSIVYSSQAFYAYSLLIELKKYGIKTVVGGPAVNQKLILASDSFLKSGAELITHISGKKEEDICFDYFPIFDAFNLNGYFVSAPVIPIQTSSTCYYQKCSFCTHHGKNYYLEFPLERIKKCVEASKQKYFFIVDDMIHKKRLLDLTKILKPLHVFFACQLKPTKDLDYKTLKELSDAGLKNIFWGFESGSQRVLDKMRKGTFVKDIKKVLEDSKKAGIKNGVYVMIGFPTETKDEFLETVNFLEENRKNIDLVSSSVFGLQKGSPVYNNPDDFGITKIVESKRTILEPKIDYTVKFGLSQNEAVSFKKKYRKTLENINKYPKEMTYFREHLLLNS
jgi:hypothetical protein